MRALHGRDRHGGLPRADSGTGSPDTVLSEELDAIVKGGAEGVLCIGLRSGASVVVKMSDGSRTAPCTPWLCAPPLAAT